MHKLSMAGAVIGMGGIVVLIIYAHFVRSRSLLIGWARQNDFEILASDYRKFRRGPFFWTSSKNQTVYYVTIRDRENQVRSGWLRCGGFWGGVWSDKTEVRWDNSATAA
jgi:hypothetical protein